VALTKARAAEVRQADVIFSTCVSARRTALLEALYQKDGGLLGAGCRALGILGG